MGRRLASAISPYLRAHADNPVDWWPWGEEAFAEAARRDVPVLVSIGYATCHWCHVMARESFSDPELAEYLNANLVAVKVDREEHPEVDAAFLAAASAFTPHLGWPLTVFATPAGRAFYAGTYFPPRPMRGAPSFRQVLEAIVEAWTDRRAEVEATGEAVTEALAARPAPSGVGLPGEPELAAAVAAIAALEDPELGGIGRDAKFPHAPVLGFLAERGARGDGDADALARRLLAATEALRDRVEGGFFRYAVQRDWSEPHYERMLVDNAQLLTVATTLGDADGAAATARFLLDVLRLPGGAFASAQDSESLVDGERSEGGYYALDAAARSAQPPPALDAKVLAGQCGLAIGALATAGARFDRRAWVDAAREAADAVLALHLENGPAGPRLRRASLDGAVSDAAATFEDYGGLAGGLLRLALASGEARYAVQARALVDACRGGEEVAVPGGGDPVLAARGISVDADRAEGAQPSGAALLADAAVLLADLTGDDAYRSLAERMLAPGIEAALAHPIGSGATLAVATRLAAAPAELVVVAPAGADAALLARARAWVAPGRVAAVVTPAQAEALADAGFALFAGRTALGGAATAYLCEGLVCRLPVTDADALAALLG